jgi:hypothetical protein
LAAADGTDGGDADEDEHENGETDVLEQRGSQMSHESSEQILHGDQ